MQPVITFEELINRRDIIEAIDWDLTPQEAFQAYQIKSIGAWKYRSLPDVYLFVIYVYKGGHKLLLVKRSLKDTEEIAEIPAPEDLVLACLAEAGGDNVPQGQYAIDDAIKAWIISRFQSVRASFPA